MREGDSKTVRLIYYVNEDLTAFFPPELSEGALAAVYAPKVERETVFY